MKKLFIIPVFALLTFSLYSCEDENPTPEKSIAQIASETDNLSSLVAAVQKAGLVDVLNSAGTYTVFAPTNAAFATFLEEKGFASLDDVPVDVLTQILLNHVFGTVKKAADLSTGYYKNLATYGATTSHLNTYINTTSGVKINGYSNVIAADIMASNGVVHVVDKVIDLPKVTTFAVADPTFSTLVAALTDSRITDVDFVDVLSGDGPFTVFAPTNAAFSALLTELSISGLADVSASTLKAVLKYHVVSGANVLAATLTDGQMVNTLLDETFEIDLSSGAKIIDGAGRTTDIIVTDVQAANGVIHVINKVLLPED